MIFLAAELSRRTSADIVLDGTNSAKFAFKYATSGRVEFATHATCPRKWENYSQVKCLGKMVFKLFLCSC